MAQFQKNNRNTCQQFRHKKSRCYPALSNQVACLNHHKISIGQRQIYPYHRNLHPNTCTITICIIKQCASGFVWRSEIFGVKRNMAEFAGMSRNDWAWWGFMSFFYLRVIWRSINKKLLILHFIWRWSFGDLTLLYLMSIPLNSPRYFNLFGLFQADFLLLVPLIITDDD